MQLTCTILLAAGATVPVLLGKQVIGTLHSLLVDSKLHWFGRLNSPHLITGQSYEDYEEAVLDVLSWHFNREGKATRFYGSHEPEAVPGGASKYHTAAPLLPSPCVP